MCWLELTWVIDIILLCFVLQNLAPIIWSLISRIGWAMPCWVLQHAMRNSLPLTSVPLWKKMAVNLEKVTKLVSVQLASIQKIRTMDHGFQSWFDSHDWKLIQANEISDNIMVASDRLGDLTSITVAINSVVRLN